ncbi:hypothetical protein WMY93_030878 [Mugilogobius chulae]|uniref:RUN domain-containing protein n=1 Tax=Mugilogobius chulae TaxID=88201 RepID=A0AAW0MP15_9GOBI
MARRRRRNTTYMSAPYYSTGLSNTSHLKEDEYEMLHYTSQIPSSPPPPPPPRPLPPIPSCATPKISTLKANSAQPERFDWLIAFTPDSDAPPHFEMRKRAVETPKKFTSSSSSASSQSASSSSAPKITTFKELRNRKSSSPPTKVITDPEPDPNIITPDPDLLYNLKWRRDKAGDGTQWEYTSQAQALFMQPPPALTSMAALQEMLQRAEEENEKSEMCPSQRKLGYSVSDSASLWNLGTQWQQEDHEMEEKIEAQVEVRGQADGERTTEIRSSASSPPFPPPPPFATRSSLPYFLHSADQTLGPNFGNPFLDAGPQKTPEISPCWDDLLDPACYNTHDFDTNEEFMDDFGLDSIWDYRNLEHANTELAQKQKHDAKFTESLCIYDSLCKSESPAAPTPYKNIDVIRKHKSKSEKCHIPHKDKASKELPPLPAFYLYHPKNCPLHRGAPPRLSPIGALSPPQRSGFPPPGAPQSGLTSPLFPRSHTLPALAAPLYYPNLYPPPLPPKLYQEPSHVATVRSVSFAGSVHRADVFMARDVGPAVRGPGLSPQCLQEKRALVSAVSVAVEAILAQFSTSRTVVQKALSGDSTSDLIAGRRPNSAWSLVQASTRPGSKTQALFNLQARVGDLPQLKQSKHRFNAFILGLLNIKHLDVWLSHLRTSNDVLETYYQPSSFMRLSLSSCHFHFEELLLVLQPLSLLTLTWTCFSTPPHAPPQPCQNNKCEEKYMESLSEEDIESGESGSGSASHSNTQKTSCESSSSSSTREEDLLETSPQLRWVKEKEISSLPPPQLEEDSLAQQAGQVMQQGWEVMVRWEAELQPETCPSWSLAAVKKEELKTEQLQGHSDFVPVNSSSCSRWW